MHIDSRRAGDGLHTTESTPSESTGSDTMLGRLGLTSRLSSRDLDPTAKAVTFKERIRPGMVVGWKESHGHPIELSIPEDLKLAVVLCPVEAVQSTFKDVLENVVNPTGGSHTETKANDTESDARYLCGLVTPGLTAEAYELNLWQQIVIDVGMMDKEVILEYDAGTRYYYISSGP